MKDPLVSIIIPNLNNQERLAHCLEAVCQQSFRSGAVEIIVVDNGSTDHSTEVCRNYPVQLLVETAHQSPYWCRNAGIAAARGSVIALLDSNCIPVNDWLAQGVNDLEKTKAAIITGPVLYSFSSKRTLAERIDYLYSYISIEDLPHLTALSAGHLFFRKSLIDEIGYFLPHIRSLGDIEWTQRAYQQGHTFGFAEGAKVHYPAKTLIPVVRKMVRLGGGRKALWRAKGRPLYSVDWMWQIGKNLLPPSPAFFQEMNYRNRKERMEVPMLFLFLGLWLVKVCRAWGMMFRNGN
ncbi:MAG: glycosyltransferase family A protein [Saprospiraceae bacterium]|nr:glycosyltransferase family 2 protein [Lewinella sp.]